MVGVLNREPKHDDWPSMKWQTLPFLTLFVCNRSCFPYFICQKAYKSFYIFACMSVIKTCITGLVLKDKNAQH